MAYSSGFSNPFGFVVTPWVKRLILANVAVFLLWRTVPSVEPFLVFRPRQLLPYVWTPITYMFAQRDFLHLLLNMLYLFFFGPPLEERWGSRAFVKFYLIAGLGGAALSLVFPNPIAGASGAVFGVMVAFAMLWPNNPIYFMGIFPIKAKWLVGGLVALEVLSARGGYQSGVAHLAHLGGAFAAFAYLKSPWAPSLWGALPDHRQSRVRTWSKSLSSLVKAPPKAVDKPTEISAGRSRELHKSLDEVDRILDKISEGGISSLTEEERRRLEEASKKFRAN